jgi:hypothetical protein
MNNAELPPPVACTLSAADFEDRTAALRRDLFPQIREIRELDSGYALRFADEPGMVKMLEEFVAFESGCCGFMSGQIERRDGESVWLVLVGPAGTKEFLAAGLPTGPLGDGAPPAAGCGCRSDRSR